MRIVTPFLIFTATAGCMAAPPQAQAPMTPQQQMRLAQLTAGKVAGQPQSCLSNWRTQDMVVIDESTIVFRELGDRVWVQKARSPCHRLGGPSYAMVTRSTMNQLCQGDIVTVVDTSANMTVGSCVMGDFVPYTTP